MPLPFHPEPGTIVVCDYTTGFREPEMVKRRLAVTISPRLKRRGNLVTIVPLSQTEPRPVEAWQCRIDVDVPHWGCEPRWAKADMLATVGFARLNLPHSKNAQTGYRQYHTIRLGDDDVQAIRQAVFAALGMVIEK